MYRKRTFRYHAYLLLIAFIINAVLPFFAVYNLSAEAKQLTSVFGEQILICTGDGFKWVKLADLQNGKEKPQPHPDYKCPLCYVANHGPKALSKAPILVRQDCGQDHRPTFACDPFLASLHLVSPQQVRAPPISFPA